MRKYRKYSTIADLEKQAFQERMKELERATKDVEGFTPIPPRSIGFSRSQQEHMLLELWSDPKFLEKLDNLEPIAINPKIREPVRIPAPAPEDFISTEAQ